jgi:hypothetical protein
MDSVKRSGDKVGGVMMMWWHFCFLIPVVLLWIYALFGVLQRDMKGWKKVAWVLAILAAHLRRCDVHAVERFDPQMNLRRKLSRQMPLASSTAPVLRRYR